VPAEGGETWFPGVVATDDDESGGEAHIAPTLGTAVFFWNTLEKPGSPGYQPRMDLHADERLRHAGLPVVQGEKWIANRWVHPIDVGELLGARVRGVQDAAPTATATTTTVVTEPARESL
jgi:hypothetical protein